MPPLWLQAGISQISVGGPIETLLEQYQKHSNTVSVEAGELGTPPFLGGCAACLLGIWGGLPAGVDVKDCGMAAAWGPAAGVRGCTGEGY